MYSALYLCPFLLFSLVSSQDCWWTGCQATGWAVRGCNDNNYVQRSSEPCPGGDKFQCCEGGGGGGGSEVSKKLSTGSRRSGGTQSLTNAFDRNNCWWTSCQPKSWGIRGCNDEDFVQTTSKSCPDGDMFKCCKIRKGKSVLTTILAATKPQPATPGASSNLFANASEGFLTQSEFNTCVQVFGYSVPSTSIFDAFNRTAQKEGGITSKLEALMAVAQMAHESAGFTARREWACSEGRHEYQCNTYDNKGCSGQYFGRGFIQLTHCYNYRPASQDLYGDDRLVTNPDLVADDDDTAMATAMWYWKKRVHDKGGSEGSFGKTTCAINCGWDCQTNPNIGRVRWQKFKECLKQTGNENLEPTESGCYN